LGESSEHRLNTIKLFASVQNEKLGILYRQNKTDKHAMLFIVN